MNDHTHETRIALLEQSYKNTNDALLQSEKRSIEAYKGMHDALVRSEERLEKGLNKLDVRLDKLEKKLDKLEEKIEKSSEKVSSTFRWLIGLSIPTVFSSIVLAWNIFVYIHKLS